MASIRQIEANRLNAQHSTGPRTEAGKAVSRLNALKSGIDAELNVIPGEDPNAFKKLIAEYLDRYQPITPDARFLVDTLITNDWLLRRLRRVEAALWTHEVKNTFKHADGPLACAAANQDQTFDRLQRRIDATLRNFSRALAQLHNLSQGPPQPALARPGTGASVTELTLVPATVPPTDPKPMPVPIGFVPPPPQSRSLPAPCYDENLWHPTNPARRPSCPLPASNI